MLFDGQCTVGHPFATRNMEVLTSPCTLAGRAIFFFMCVCCGARVAHGQVRRAKSGFRGGVLETTTAVCRSFVFRVGCVRLYSTIPKVYYVIDTWRILGPAPIIRNPVHPTIPHGTLPKSQAQRKRENPDAKEDSKNGGDGSPQWIVNMWAMMWGSKRPTPGKLCEST